MAGPARTGTDPRTSPPGTAAHGARPGTRTRSQAGADAPRPTPRRATPADPPNDPAPPHRPGPDPPGQDDTQLFRSLLELVPQHPLEQLAALVAGQLRDEVHPLRHLDGASV